MGVSKVDKRKKIKYRIRKRVKGTPQRPRVTVFRSNKGFYAQAIDDISGQTLASISSLKEDIPAGSKVEQAKELGKRFAKIAQDNNINNLVFDRNGYLYHGRVKAFADGVREGGIKI